MVDRKRRTRIGDYQNNASEEFISEPSIHKDRPTMTHSCPRFTVPALNASPRCSKALPVLKRLALMDAAKAAELAPEVARMQLLLEEKDKKLRGYIAYMIIYCNT